MILSDGQSIRLRDVFAIGWAIRYPWKPSPPATRRYCLFVGKDQREIWISRTDARMVFNALDRRRKDRREGMPGHLAAE